MFAEHCLGDQTMDNMMSLIVLKCPWVAETLSAMRERSCCNGSSTSQKGMVSTSPTLSLHISPQQSFPSTLLQSESVFPRKAVHVRGVPCAQNGLFAGCVQGSTVQGHTQHRACTVPEHTQHSLPVHSPSRNISGQWCCSKLMQLYCSLLYSEIRKFPAP